MPKKHTSQVLKSLESVTPSKRTRISFPPIKEQKNNLISSCYKLSPWISLNRASVNANCVYNKLRYNVFKIFSWLSITQPINELHVQLLLFDLKFARIYSHLLRVAAGRRDV